MSAPIKREDIREGDRVRMTCELTVSFDPSGLNRRATYELIEHPMPLPTVPGYYLGTNVGITPAWQLTVSGDWYYVGNPHRTIYGGSEAGDPACHMPLTLLRPVAEVASEVLAEVRRLSIRNNGFDVAIMEFDMRIIEGTFGVAK